MATKRSPTPADFPPNVTLTITPPPAATSTPSPPPNILLLLHGLGDSAESFTSFARALQLPETTILTIQAPNRLPFDLDGFHWGDDVVFASKDGALDMDAGSFSRSLRLIVDDVIRSTLCGKCGYDLREIMILGFGQGGMVGLLVAREVAGPSSTTTTTTTTTTTATTSTSRSGGTGTSSSSLSGVISIGAPYPLSAKGPNENKRKSQTPVLLVAGRESIAVSEDAVKRTKDVFEYVEVARYPTRKGDGMPRNRDEMLPVMRFLATRLRSRRGVPEGSVEIT